MVSFRSKPPEQAKNSSKELGEKMASLIIGHGGILDVLRSKVPNSVGGCPQERISQPRQTS